MGGYISFSGIITFPKSLELREIAADVPLDRLLVETDAPYLAPVPFRGKRNEPAYTAHTAKILGEHQGLVARRCGRVDDQKLSPPVPEGSVRVVLLGVGGSAGSPQIGGADGFGDWGQLDPAEPRNRRSRASIVIEASDQRRLLVDTPPDLRQQLTDNGIGRIDAVLYTHAHADHIAGLDEIRILNRILDAPMPSYADARTWGELHLRFDYAFKPYAGGFFSRPVLEAHTIAPG